MRKYACLLLMLIFMVLLNSIGDAKGDVNSGLIAYYPFNENAYDYSSNGNHGVVQGAQLTDDREGNSNSAFSFNGDDSYIDCGEESFFKLSEGGTISAWIRPSGPGGSGNGYGRIVDKSTGYDGIGGYSLFMSGVNERVHLEMEDVRLKAADNSVLYHSWTHVAVTFNGIERKIYVNGVLSAFDNQSILPVDMSGHLYIGNRVGTPDRGFDGAIDEVCLFDYALGSDEVLKLYNGELPALSVENKMPDKLYKVPYASYDELLGQVFIPNVLIMDESYWLTLQLYDLASLSFALVDWGVNGTGSPCAFFDTETNVLSLRPFRLNNDYWNADLTLVSAEPLLLQLRAAEPAETTGQVHFEGVSIFERTLSPTGSDQVVVDPNSGIQMDIPGELISENTLLSLKEITNQPLPFETVDWGRIMDVSLGDLTTLAEPVQLTFPLDISALPAEIQLESIHVAHWDDSLQSWEFWNSTVDLVNGHVTVLTDRLSPWAWFFSEDISVTSPMKYFTIFYNKDQKMPDGSDVSVFALRLGGYLDEAYEAYKGLGFVMPDTPHSVVLFEASSGDPPHYEGGWYGLGVGEDHIYYPLKSSVTDAIMRHDAAHELFHSVQNRYLSVYVMGYQKWFMEATAESAAFFFIDNGSDAGLVKLNTYFFSEPLASKVEEHQYQAANFINYLVQTDVVDFKILWEKVATSTITPALDVINSFLRDSTGQWLSRYWKAFVVYAFTGNYALFSSNSGDSSGFPLSERTGGTISLLKSSENEIFWSCQLPSGLTARTWGVRAIMPEGVASRKLIIEPLTELPSDVTLNIFLIQDYQTNNQVEQLAELTHYSSELKVEAEMDGNDAIFVIATNTDIAYLSDIQTIRLRIREKSDLSVSLPEKLTAVKDVPLTIQPTISGGNTPYTFEWSIDGNLKGTEENLQVTYEEIAPESPVWIKLIVEDSLGNTASAEVYVEASGLNSISFSDSSGIYSISIDFVDFFHPLNSELIQMESSGEMYDVVRIWVEGISGGIYNEDAVITVDGPDLDRWYIKTGHSLDSTPGLITPEEDGIVPLSSDSFYNLKIFNSQGYVSTTTISILGRE